ncbi:MAG: type II toxin-antitoxin system CcdA family antitoxin [Rubrimonas sp.]
MSASPRGRKAANLTLDPGLVAEAKALGVNVSRAAETGLRAAVAEARAEAWRRENAEALASANAWVAAHGLPLARFRPF